MNYNGNIFKDPKNLDFCLKKKSKNENVLKKLCCN